LARKILKLRKHNEQLQEQVTAENKMIKFRREQFSSMEKQLEAGEKFMHNVLADTDMQKEVSMLGLGAKKAAPTAAPQQEAEPVSFLELNARKKHHHKKHLRLVSSALEESADVAPAPRADSAESVIAATELIIDNEPETQPALELDVSKSPAVPAVKPAPEVENDVQKKPMARLAAPGLPTQVHVPLFPLADGTGVVEAAAQSKAEKDADEDEELDVSKSPAVPAVKPAPEATAQSIDIKEAEKDADEDEELDVSKSPAVPAVKPAPEATAQSTGIKEAKKDADEDEELPAVPAMKPAPEAATPVMQAKEVKTQEADEEPVEIELPPSMAEKSPEDDEKLFSSLSQQLTRMRSAAQKTEKHLKAMFEDSWKAGKTRHEALLNQQAVLEKSLTSMTTYEGKLEKTSEHFKAVIQTLEHQLGLGANFLEHIEKEAVAPVKEVRAAAQEADASNPLVIASNN